MRDLKMENFLETSVNVLKTKILYFINFQFYILSKRHLIKSFDSNFSNLISFIIILNINRLQFKSFGIGFIRRNLNSLIFRSLKWQYNL